MFNRPIVVVSFLVVLLVFIPLIVSASTIWTEDFESGWGAWTADNGVWQVGQPCSTQ